MPFNSGSTPSDSTFRGSIAARSSPPFSHSSPASSDGLLPTGGIAFSFDSRSPSAQTLTGGILPGGSSSDAARRRESSQQDGGPSNIFGASRSGSGRTPLFGQPPSQDGSPSNIFPANSSSTRRAPLFAESSSNPGTPFSFPCLSPAHPSVQGNALFGASSANARQSRESSPQSRGTSNIFSSASPSSGGAALFGQSPSRAESIFSFQYLSPRVQSPDNNALFGGTFRNANPSQVTTPQNDSSPSLFAQPSRQSSISRVLSPQNSSAANTPSTHTSGAPLFGPGSASAGSSRGLRFHGGPSNIFGPQSNTSSPLPSPSRPASSSTTSDGGGVLTPRSDSRSLFSASASNLNLNASPGPASRSPSVDQHHVQPSIEQQDDAPGTPASFRNRRRTTRSSTSQTLSAHGQIPSVSLSPPVQGRGSRLNDMGSVDRDLAQLRLSTSTATPRRSNTSTNTETGMGMGAIAAALNNLDYDRSASGLLTPSPGSRYPLNDDNALLTPRPSPRRRRSSSAAAPPHNIRDETPPNDRFNAAPFQNALSGARTLMGELANVLGSGALHREPKSVISQSYAQAQRLNGFECSSRRTVVLVGDSGTEIIKAMNASMEPSWNALSRSSETRMESITSIVTGFMNWAMEYLEAELHDLPDSFEILTEALTSRGSLLVAAIENAWNDFDNNLSLLQRDATKPMRTSFIGRGMEEACQAANHESGGGAHTRRKSHITNTASSPHLFLTILQTSRTEFHALTSTLERRVRETVAEHAASVVETLDIVRGEDAAREADGDPAFRARVEREVGRVRGVMRGLIAAGGI